MGIDAKSNRVLYRLDCISEATRLGFRNVSMIINNQGGRQISKDVRWFKESEFDADNIPALRDKKTAAKAVRCIETGEIFLSAVDASKEMRTRGFMVSGSKISSVCKGNRPKTGGFTWEYA